MVGTESARPGAGQASLSGCGPAGPEEENRRELIRHAIASGATAEEIEAAEDIGELVLDLNLRPRLEFTLREVIDAAGIDQSKAQRLLAATGIPWSADEHVTAGEAATVELLATAASELFGEAATLQLARVAGRAMAQIAETLVAAFRLQVELPRLAAGVPDVELVKGYADIAQGMLPAFVGTLDVLLRRQIVAVAERTWSTDAERSAVTLPRSIGFADLVGYTAAAATMSVHELMSTLVEFDERTADVVLRGNGQIVKTIGDQAMFVTEHAGDACRIALRARRRVRSQSTAPDPRRAGRRPDRLRVRRPLRARRQPRRPARRRRRTVHRGRVRVRPRCVRRHLPLRGLAPSRSQGLRPAGRRLPRRALTHGLVRTGPSEHPVPRRSGSQRRPGWLH